MYRRNTILGATLAVALAATLSAQTYPGGGTGSTGTTGGTTGGTSGSGATGLTPGAASRQQIAFDRPEAWALKYFSSATMLSGLQPPDPSPEARHFGSITLGFETGWLPELSTDQRRVGFNGHKVEDLSKAPIFARPVVRVGLPAKFAVVAAAPPPFKAFGMRTHLLALGLERPIVDRAHWTLGWRGYGQFGSVKGSFTCPTDVLAFAPGTAGNPGRCVGESNDVASLNYAGTELQLSFRIPGARKLVPHIASGINYIDAAFQVDAPVVGGRDRTYLWTHGKTFSETGGVSYLISQRVAVTIDAFYAPLSVRRTADDPRTNDGMFNVRAAVSYSLR